MYSVVKVFMINLLIQPFKEMFSFKGRTTRKEFWVFAIFWGIIMDPLIPQKSIIEQNLKGILLTIIYLFYCIAQLSLSVRRLHDTNRSGWWNWLSIIPIVGVIWLFILFCLDGTKGKNNFGPDPKKR